MTRYHHRQRGTLVLLIGGLSVLLIVLLLLSVEANPIGIAVLLCLALCLTLFSTLAVEVTDTDIRLRFGPGLIRKRIPLSSVRSASAVRNASGLDAVELAMTDGSVIRIGTDQPTEWLGGIKATRGAAARRWN